MPAPSQVTWDPDGLADQVVRTGVAVTVAVTPSRAAVAWRVAQSVSHSQVGTPTSWGLPSGGLAEMAGAGSARADSACAAA